MDRTFTKSDSSEENLSDEDMEDRDDKPIHLQFESNGSSSSQDDEENPDAEKPANTVLKAKKTTAAKHPPYVKMIASAISSVADRKGATVRSIKMYIIANHFLPDDAKMKRNLRSQLDKGLASGMLIRPKPKKGAKEATGLQGRFKLNPQWVKDQEKKQKVAAKAKAQKAKKKTTSSKAKAPKVDGSNLTSLKDKSYSVRLAQDKIKKARKSLAMSPAVTKLTKKRPTVKKKADGGGEGEKPAIAKKAKSSKGKSEAALSNDDKPKKKAKPTTDGNDKNTAKKKTSTKPTKEKAATKAKPATTKKKTSVKTTKAKA